MRVLILSCNTGEGHNSCAEALREYFTAQWAVCIVEDALRFLSDGMSDFISHWHTRIYRHMPDLFRTGYRFVEVHPSLLQEGSVVYRALTGGAGRLYRFLAEGGGDAFFPNLDKNSAWQLEYESDVHNCNGLEFKFTTYKNLAPALFV